jgi:pimeloyl-ACP methyl ester carboxylesterase
MGREGSFSTSRGRCGSLAVAFGHGAGGSGAIVGDVEVRGLRIAYERRGSGPPLVLLHGGVSDHREWRRQLEGLSDAFTVVAWDAPGTGGSSDPPESFRFDDYADGLAGFVERLELDRPHVAGLSWGSTLALALYERRPELPRSLILTGAYAGWAGSLTPDEVGRRLEGALRGMQLPADEYARSWIPTLLTGRASPEMVEELATIIRGFRPSGVRPMLLAMAEADLRPMLPTIRVPTLLLYGEEDVRSPRVVAEEMHRAIPGSELVFLPGVGHMTNVEAADRVNDEVRRFLRSVSGADP